MSIVSSDRLQPVFRDLNGYPNRSSQRELRIGLLALLTKELNIRLNENFLKTPVKTREFDVSFNIGTAISIC